MINRQRDKTEVRVSKCPVRDVCRRYIRHEGYEVWKFCNIRERLYKIQNPTQPGKESYCGYPRDNFCKMNGRTKLADCEIYTDACRLGLIKEGKIP